MIKNRTFEEQFRDMLRNSIYGKSGDIKPITIEISSRRDGKKFHQEYVSNYPNIITKEGK